MITKSQIKLITSLKQKKFRQQHGFFVAEGVKTIKELLQSSFKLHALFATKPLKIDANIDGCLEANIISEKELKRISFLKTPNTALAVFKIPEPQPVKKDGFIVALDAVNDPGNLGTIIRLCDWFGVKDLVCSSHTVDCFNPKVIQATMGSITRVNVSYVDLEVFLKNYQGAVFGAFMDGKNVYTANLPKQGVLVLGNEANGISAEIEGVITQKIAIPRFGDLQVAESLNVATAAAVLLSEFKRDA